MDFRNSFVLEIKGIWLKEKGGFSNLPTITSQVSGRVGFEIRSLPNNPSRFHSGHKMSGVDLTSLPSCLHFLLHQGCNWVHFALATSRWSLEERNTSFDSLFFLKPLWNGCATYTEAKSKIMHFHSYTSYLCPSMPCLPFYLQSSDTQEACNRSILVPPLSSHQHLDICHLMFI